MSRTARESKIDRTGRLLALAVLAAALGAAWCHRHSRLAGRLAAAKPVTGMLSVRFEGQGRVVTPALYYLIYDRLSGALDLILIPPETPLRAAAPELPPRTLADVYGDAYLPRDDTTAGTRALGEAALELITRGAPPDFWFDFSLPPDARPAFPLEMKRLIAGAAADALFWPRLFRAAAAAMDAEWSGWTPYDLLLAARELRRLDPDAIRLARLPAPELLPRFFQNLSARAAGRAEPDETATVEILNATETPGVALMATKILRLHGFDVVHFGNSSTMQATMRVVDRAGRYEAARGALKSLGCSGGEVLTALEAEPSAAITVVLGRDYARCTELGKSQTREKSPWN